MSCAINTKSEISSMRPRRKILGLILGLCALGSLFSGVSIAKDVYLAVRQDGREGSGSAQDPFDASSAAKYDAILARFREATNFFYSPGIYETTGGRYRIRPTANPHCHHFGAGVARTIIRLVGASHPTEEGTIFYADYDSTVDGFELHDLALDCNAPGNPKFRDGVGAVSAVNVVGNNMLFSNLKVEHFGTGKRGVECFPFLSYAGPGHGGHEYENIRLENSVFTEPATGNKDGLSCAVIAASTDARLEGAIVNCRFINLKSDFSYSHAFGAAICRGNVVIGCETGFYLEPDDQQSGTWIVRHNEFRNVITAAMVKWHPTGSLNTIQFEDNDVILKVYPERTSAAFAVDDAGLKPGDEKPTIAKVILRNNKISLAGPSKEQVSRAAGLHLVSLAATYSVGEVFFENNSFSLPAGREMIISPSPVVRSFFQHGNVDSNNREVRVRDVHGNAINPL
ncbi:MAG: hypothetical protein JO151_00275 [Verrucomicrobia bacterium]|nr:hypothetical protein [Verrucomicrobiota bacterium]